MGNESSGIEARVVGKWGELYHDPLTGKQKARLTADGKRALADWLVEHPRPISLLVRVYPSMYQYCLGRGMTHDVIESACYEGMAKGFIRFQEGRSAKIESCLPWAIRGAVADLIRRDARRREVQISHEWNGQETDYGSLEPFAPDEHHHHDNAVDVSAILNRSKVTDRERKVLTGRAMGVSCKDVGKLVRLSHTRVQHIEALALTRIRRIYGIPKQPPKKRKKRTKKKHKNRRRTA